MNKLNELFSRCKASVTIEYNPHRGVYESVEEYVGGWGNGECIDEIEPAVFSEMINRDTVVRIQFYPNTPIGFYKVWHYDLEQAVDQALIILNEQ